MKAINWVAHQDLLGAELMGISPVVLYVLSRGRNAWHSTWVTNYSGPSALVNSRNVAKQIAERRRVQGNVFYIAQVPGLLLKSLEGPVALVEFHSRDCFSRWDHERGRQRLRLGTPLGETLRALGPNGLWQGRAPSSDSFISGIADWEPLTVLPPRKPLERWVSESLGGTSPLVWHGSTSRYSRQGVNRIVRTFEEVNASAERVAASREYEDAAVAGAQRAREEADRAHGETLASLERAIQEALDMLDALGDGSVRP